MPSPSFQIDQPTGAGSGTTGLSRDDLWVSTSCNLTATNPPVGATFLWTLLYQPPTSSATITNPSSMVATFEPDVLTQSFRLNLKINAGGPGLSFNFIIAATKTNTGVLANRGWRTPALNEQDDEGNFAGNTSGYTPDYDKIVLDILANAEFGSSPTGYFYITFSSSPYTIPNSGVVHLDIDTTHAPQGNIQVNLPVAPSLMQYLELKDLGAAAAYNITIDGNGNTIDGESSYVISSNLQCLVLRYNGAAWEIVSNGGGAAIPVLRINSATTTSYTMQPGDQALALNLTTALIAITFPANPADQQRVEVCVEAGANAFSVQAGPTPAGTLIVEPYPNFGVTSAGPFDVTLPTAGPFGRWAWKYSETYNVWIPSF